jgi:Domain of unknown function (DUF4158)
VSEKMFSREQYEQLRSFPEISRDELFRYFTLTSADVAFVDPGAGRGPADRLGMAVQLSTLPWLGFVPEDVASAPPAAVARLAEQLGLDPGALRGYGKRAHTRSDHLNKVAKYLTWKTAAAGSREMKELEGTVALSEGGHGRLWPVCCLDAESEFGEGCWDPVVRVEVEGQFVVSAAQVLDERMSCADHLR